MSRRESTDLLGCESEKKEAKERRKRNGPRGYVDQLYYRAREMTDAAPTTDVSDAPTAPPGGEKPTAPAEDIEAVLAGKKRASTKAAASLLQEHQRAQKEAQKQRAVPPRGGAAGGNKGGGGGGGGGGKGGGGGGALLGDGGGGGGGGGGKEKAAAAAAGSSGAAAADSKGTSKQPRPAAAPMQHDDASALAKLQKKQIAPRTPSHKQVALFAHLPQYEKESSITAAAVAKGSIHPAVLRLGLQFAEGLIAGTNSRVVGMLRAFQQVIRDFEPPQPRSFRVSSTQRSRRRSSIWSTVDRNRWRWGMRSNG